MAEPQYRYLAPRVEQGVLVLTPSGKISKYFYGIYFTSADVGKAVADAGAEKIGRPVPSYARVLLLCYDYDAATGKYFNMDFSAPVIEFTYESPVVESWNGQPALTQGRIWASFETENKAFEKWYNAVVRWIRKNFIRDLAVGHDRDSFGPAAYEWFRTGGLLLPNFRPPLTDAWLAWASVQNQHRADLTLT